MSAPNISWSENGSNGDQVIAQVRGLLGDHQWLVFVPTPRPHDPVVTRLAGSIGAAVLPLGNLRAFVVPMTSVETALRVIFEWGPAEAALMSFAGDPDAEMIANALANDDARPASRLLLFDSNELQSVV